MIYRGHSWNTGNYGSYSSPRFESDWTRRRKQMLANLLEQLMDVSRDSDTEADITSLSATEEELPTLADIKVQEAGADQFFKFQKQVENLDIELCNFANAARQLGSSVGILSSAFRLRERFTNIVFLFRENASSLFPRRIARHPREVLLNPDLIDNDTRRAGWRRTRPLAEDSLPVETLPFQFESLATDVKNFLDCLNEFPEFTDVAVNQSMKEFEGNLRYWAVHLNEYKTQFRSPPVQRYVHDLTSEIGYHVDTVAGALAMFIEIGVPTISSHQQHGAINLSNLSTVATFFSGVTATTLQFSYSTTNGPLSEAVNTLWFSSLVFSIAAAVNSLLGLTWKKAMYRSPRHRVPWWVLIWIRRSPLVFLVMSIACFSTGLMLFTYSSQQGRISSTIITVLTVITSSGLAAVSIWFASERWIFVRHGGQKWLADVIAELARRITALRIVRATSSVLDWCSTLVPAVRAFFKQFLRRMSTTAASEDHVLPLHSQSGQPQPFCHPLPTVASRDMQKTISRSVDGGTATSPTSNLTERPTLSEKRSDETVALTPFHARQRFVNAVRTVIMLGAASRARSPAMDMSGASRMTRISNDMSKLDMLSPIHESVAHQALVRHLQFSPNGKYLATAGWDKLSVLFEVEENGALAVYRVLGNGPGLIGQVAWSPNGKVLLIRLPRVVKVWSECGVCEKSIDRQKHIQSIVWLPNGEGFLSVEGSNVVKLDYRSGKVLDTYNLGQVQLCSVAVSQDCVRLVGVGPTITPPDGPHPSRHIKVEKRIIVYNMVTKTKESQIPFASDVRDIVMARKSSLVLISLVKAPPQLWTLEVAKERDTSRLSFKQTYSLKTPNTEITGPSYLGGSDDQFVLYAAKAGNVHIWDRDSAVLLHFISPPNPIGNLTCIGWNFGTNDPFMLATGSHDGVVRVWSTSVPPDEPKLDGS